MNTSKKASHFLFWGTLVIPLNSPSPQWHTMTYSNLKPNVVYFSKQGLTIKVNSSASPLFYELPKVVKVKTLKVSGEFLGLPKSKPTATEGEDDDLPLRLGLVESSNEKPSWIQKFLSPQWIKELFELFPNQGIKKVRFITLSTNKEVGDFRIHPKSDFLEETVALKQKNPGPFDINYIFTTPIPAIALWIQCDGDNTQSNFTVRLKTLEIETEK